MQPDGANHLGTWEFADLRVEDLPYCSFLRWDFLPRQTELALIDDHNGCVDRSLKLRQGQFFAIGFAHVVVHDYGWRDIHIREKRGEIRLVRVVDKRLPRRQASFQFGDNGLVKLKRFASL